jgi:hypothetical protein
MENAPKDIYSNDFVLNLTNARGDQVAACNFTEVINDTKKVTIDITSDIPSNFAGRCAGLLIWTNPDNFEVFTLCQIIVDVVDDAHINSSTTNYLPNNSTLNINAAEQENTIEIAITSGLQGPQGEPGRVQLYVIEINSGSGTIPINTSEITADQTLILNNTAVLLTIQFIVNDGASFKQNLTTPLVPKSPLIVFRNEDRIYYR